MKTKFTTILLALLLGIAGVNAQNLLTTNPGFENGISPWITDYTTTAEIIDEGHSGNNSLLFSGELFYDLSGYDFTNFFDKTFTLSFWYKTTEDETAFSTRALMAFDADYSNPLLVGGDVNTVSVVSSDQWQYYTLTLQPLNQNSDLSSYSVLSLDLAVNKQILIDDVSLTVKNGSDIAVTGVTLNKNTTSLAVDATEQLTATVAPENATNKNLTWASNNEAVATVSTTGLVTAIAAGETTITVTSKDGSFTATCNVTVNAASTQNLLTDPGFENGSFVDDPFNGGWYLFQGGGNFIEGTIADGDVFTGTHSGMLYSTTGISSMVYNFINITNEGKKDLVLTFHYKYIEPLNEYKNIQVNAALYNADFETPEGGEVIVFSAKETSEHSNFDNAEAGWREVNINIDYVKNSTVELTNYPLFCVCFQIDGCSVLIDDVSLTVKSGSDIAVTGVTLNKNTTSLTVGATEQLTATVAPENATNKNLTWASNNEAIATVSTTGLVSAVDAGYATITATTENGSFSSTCTVTVTKQEQTINNFTNITKTFGDADFNLSATASSGLDVSYTSSNTDVATISGSTITIVGAGTSTITASQAGDNDYKAATKMATLTVNKALQTISGLNDITKAFSDADFNLSATASSGLDVAYTSSNTDVATISSSTITIVGAGTSTITASQAGNNNYKAATEMATLKVDKASQTISGLNDITKAFGDADFNLLATASSGLDVAYTSSNTDVATVSGNTITIVGAGTSTITASQSGNDNYKAATGVTITLTVNAPEKQDQSISNFEDIAKTYGDAEFELSATASSSLDIIYSSSETEVATISGNTVTIKAAGTTTITASQTGNDTYNAVSATVTLTVNKASQIISNFSNIARKEGDSDTTLAAIASSGFEITYTVVDNTIATISGSTLHVIKAGTTNITATQAGNNNYEGVSETVSLTVDFGTGLFDKDNADLGLSVYPNPINEGILHISFDQSFGQAHISILSATGQLLSQKIVEKGITQTEISTANLLNGIYFVVYSDKNGRQTKKLIKQ